MLARWRCPSCGPRRNLALLNDKAPWPGDGCPAARLVARAPAGTRAPGTGTGGERMEPDHPIADRGHGEVPPGGERFEAGPEPPRTSPRRRCAAGRRRRRSVRSRRVAAGPRQRRRSCHSGKRRATKRAGSGRRQAHRWPMWSARDLPRPAPRQRPGPAYEVSFAGRSAVFRRRRFGPALLRKAPRCSCPAVACGDRGVSKSTWAAGLLFGADGVAVTVSVDRTAGDASLALPCAQILGWTIPAPLWRFSAIR